MTLGSIRNSPGKIVDLEWLSLNDKAYSILKYEPCHLIGKKFSVEMPEWIEDGLFTKLVEVVDKGSSMNYKHCWHKLKKDKIWLNLEVSKLEDGVLIVFQDISSSKYLEDKLSQIEKKFNRFESAANIGHWEFDIHTKKITWSDEIFKIFGMKPQSVEPTLEIGYSMIHPDDRESTRQAIHHAIYNNINYKSEKRIVRPNGEIRWVISEAELIKNKEGEPVKLFGYYLDITDRIESEIKLKKSENLFRSIFYGASVGISLVQLDGKLFKVNQKLCKMLEYSEDELSQLSYDKLTYPEDLEKDTTLFNKLKAKEIDAYEIEKRFVTKSGKVFWGLLTISIVYDEHQQLSFVVGRIQDINERKLTEWKLEESERRFRAIFNSSFQFTGLLNPQGIVLEANKTALDFADKKPSDIIGKPIWEANLWNISEDAQTDLQEAVSKSAKGEFVRYEVKVLNGKGKLAYLDFSINPVLDESGKVVLLIPEGRDISEKIISEKKLAESEKQFKLFVNQAPTGIAMFDKSMNYLAASAQWSSDFNITEDLIGKNHDDIFPEIPEEWKKLRQECLTGKVIKRMKDPFVRQDGSIMWLRWELRPWYDTNNEIGGFVLFSENITDDVHQEESILKLNKELHELNQQKIKLFSVIAHDIKSPINNCVGLLEVIFIEKEKLKKEDIFHYLKLLQKSAYTVNELIEELLTWSQTQIHNLIMNPERIFLLNLIDNLLKPLKSVAESKSLTIELDVDSSMIVLADQNMLRTIIRNLISNSIKFTKPGGIINIKAEIMKEFALVSVIDNGVGIKEADLEKLFSDKSNFSTYGTAGERGTGLGLDLVQNFVEQNGGEVEVRSIPGQGSTFSFTVPLANYK